MIYFKIGPTKKLHNNNNRKRSREATTLVWQRPQTVNSHTRTLHTETRARARTVAGSDICLRRGRVACPPPLSAHSTSTHCIPPRRIPLNARAGRRRRRRRLSRRGRLTLSISIARLLSSAAAARQFYNFIFTLLARGYGQNSIYFCILKRRYLTRNR